MLRQKNIVARKKSNRIEREQLSTCLLKVIIPIAVSTRGHQQQQRERATENKCMCKTQYNREPDLASSTSLYLAGGTLTTTLCIIVAATAKSIRHFCIHVRIV